MTKKEGLKKRKLPVTKRLHDQFVMVYVHNNVGTVQCSMKFFFNHTLDEVFFQDSEGTIASAYINDNSYKSPADLNGDETIL